MGRELCLVLDKEGMHRLILKVGSSEEIDEYTTKFENSEQIREKYKEQIEEFLEKYKEAIKKSKNPNYEGRIVIVIPENIGREIKEYQREVLYKKHIIAFKKFIEDKWTMMKFVDYEKNKRGKEKLVSDYFCSMVRRPWNNKTGAKGFIKNWAKEEKEKKNIYYQIVRDMMMAYREQRLYVTSLPSLEEIYDNYIREKEEKAKKRVKKRNKMKVQRNESHTIVEDSIVIENTQSESAQENSNVTEEPALDIPNTHKEQVNTPESEEFSEEKLYNINGVLYTEEEAHKFLDLDSMVEHMTNGEIDKDSSYIPDGAKKI